MHLVVTGLTVAPGRDGTSVGDSSCLRTSGQAAAVRPSTYPEVSQQIFHRNLLLLQALTQHVQMCLQWK